MMFLSCLYDGSDPATYRGFRLRGSSDQEPMVFNTGNPTVDYITAGCVAYTLAGGPCPVMGTSSIEHFVFDGGILNTDEFTEEEVRAGRENARRYLESR